MSLADMLVFLATLCLVLGAGTALASIRDRAGPAASGEPGLSGPLAGMVRWLAMRQPRSAAWVRYLAQTEPRLVLAYGARPRPGAALHLAQWEVLAAAAALLAYLIGTLFGLGTLAAVIGALLCGAGSVHYGASGYLRRLASARQVRITRQFPFFLDVAVMMLESGAGIEEVLTTYAERNPDDELGVEARQILRELAMGGALTEALEKLCQRMDAEEVLVTLRALIQGIRLGAPLAKVFRDQAEVSRFRRVQLAERAAEELKVKLIGPSMLVTMGLVLLVLGAAIIRGCQGGVV